MTGEPALGLAFRPGHLVAALVSPADPEQRVVEEIEFGRGQPQQAVKTARELALRLGATPRAEGEPPSVLAVGAAVPGQIDYETGTVVYGPNLESRGRAWHGQKLAAMLAHEFQATAVVDNDVNAMAVYHRELGLGRDEDSFVVVYLAPGMTGLGSGIVIDGKIVRGCVGGAGEFGHLVVQPGGPRCPCGNRGCLEAVVGVETIVRNVNWGGRDLVPGSELSDEKRIARAAQLAEEGDPLAVATFRQTGRWFGQGLSALVNLLNPPLTIIGGPEEIVGSVPEEGVEEERRVMRSAELFREGYEATRTRYSYGDLDRDSRIAIDRVTLEMAAVGAALLAMRREPFPSPQPQAPTGETGPAPLPVP